MNLKEWFWDRYSDCNSEYVRLSAFKDDTTFLCWFIPYTYCMYFALSGKLFVALASTSTSIGVRVVVVSSILSVILSIMFILANARDAWNYMWRKAGKIKVLKCHRK